MVLSWPLYSRSRGAGAAAPSAAVPDAASSMRCKAAGRSVSRSIRRAVEGGHRGDRAGGPRFLSAVGTAATHVHTHSATQRLAAAQPASRGLPDPHLPYPPQPHRDEQLHEPPQAQAQRLVVRAPLDAAGRHEPHEALRRLVLHGAQQRRVAQSCRGGAAEQGQGYARWLGCGGSGGQPGSGERRRGRAAGLAARRGQCERACAALFAHPPGRAFHASA